MGDFAIRAEHVSKRYRRGLWAHETLRSFMASRLAQIRGRENIDTGWFDALHDVSFDLRHGESVALVGDNGAGKSTILKILSRITPPTTGRISLNGRVGSLLEVGSGFHSELTGRDNIFLNGLLLGMSRLEVASRFDEIVAFSGVEQFLDTPVKRYSSGMYMRLAFAVAAHLETEILLVDEALAVGDLAFQQKCLDRMNSFSASGRTIIFVSHNLTAIRSLCERAILIDKGEIVDDGPTGRIVHRYLQAHPGGNRNPTFFEPQSAPVSGRVSVLGASARPRAGAVGDPIHVKTDIVVEFNIRIAPEEGGHDPRVHPSITLRNAGGELIFSVSPPEEPSKWSAGTYRLKCHVPRDILNDGLHVVGLEIREIGSDPLLLPRLLEIDVMDHDGDRFGWYGVWPGLIRPRLAWERERTGD